MGIWELLTTSEEDRRRRAREAFQAGMMQPQIFQTQDFPIEQMAPAYQKGYGMPYPTRQMPNPTAGMQGMTFDPNRGQQVVQPANLPIEYVQPRSAMEMATNQANIAGSGLAETKLSELEGLGAGAGRIRGYFDDLGADPDEYDIAGLGGFGRIPQGEQDPGTSYTPPEWVPNIGAYRQYEQTEGQTGPGKAIYSPQQKKEGGADDDPLVKEYERALNTYKAFNQRLDPMTQLLINQIGPAALKDPGVQDRIKGRLQPEEQKQLEFALQFINYYQQRRRRQYGLGQIPAEQTQQEAATAEDFLKRKGLRP